MDVKEVYESLNVISTQKVWKQKDKGGAKREKSEISIP